MSRQRGGFPNRLFGRSIVFDDEDDDALSPDMNIALPAILGDDGFFLLLEQHAGMRLYIPNVGGCHKSQLAYTITIQKAEKLAEIYGGEYIKIPLARRFRARIFRERGLSHGQIAKLLGMSESGVYKLLKEFRPESAANEQPSSETATNL